MFYLTGDYVHQLDAKNRIRIPAKLKKELGDKYFFARGTEGCLFVFPEEIMKQEIERVEAINLTDTTKRMGARVFLKSIVPAEEDNQGRVVLPSQLKAIAHIQKDIHICGNGSRVEIWAKEVYDEYFKDEDGNFDAYFDSLGI
jgi:MraZ protein